MCARELEKLKSKESTLPEHCQNTRFREWGVVIGISSPPTQRMVNAEGTCAIPYLWQEPEVNVVRLAFTLCRLARIVIWPMHKCQGASGSLKARDRSNYVSHSDHGRVRSFWHSEPLEIEFVDFCVKTLKKVEKRDNSMLSGACPQPSFRSEHSRLSKQGI